MRRIYRCPMHGPDDLERQGPTVVANIRPSWGRQHELRMPGKDIPSAPVHLLIDTGATSSVMLSSVVHHLDLVSIREQPIQGIGSTKPISCPVYAATIELPMKAEDGTEGLVPIPLTFSAVTPSVFGAAPYQGLLGRDFLRHFLFGYSGPDGVFELRSDTDWFYD